MTVNSSTAYRLCAIVAAVLVAACQQTKPPPSEQELLASQPPSLGLDSCPALGPDWLDAMPAHQKRILPDDCQRLTSTPLFSWAEARDRLANTMWSFTLRQKGGVVVYSRSDVGEPRLILKGQLPVGEYEWAVAYTSNRGVTVATHWRRFVIESAAFDAGLMSNAPVLTSTQGLPDGQTLAYSITAKARPRILPAGSSYAKIAAAAQAPDFLPVLNALRGSASSSLSQPLPITPAALQAASDLEKLQQAQTIRNTAAVQRAYIEILALIGRLDSNSAMLNSARQRLLALAAWSPTGPSSEANNDQANREIYLALATGLDIFWSDLTASERTLITAALRDRVLQASTALRYLDNSPYDSHGIANVRWITQTLLLSAGLPGFPEAQALLAHFWDLSRFTLGAWGDKDGSFGNGIAYAWYSFITVVPYTAAVRSITGIDLYQLEFLRRAGEQLVAFTAPNFAQTSAFGDETETTNLYANNASNIYRLHAQMTRDPVDAWYWQANPANINRPALQLIWQLLLLGADPSPLPRPQPVSKHTWFFPDAGLAAMHVNAAQSARTSVFFRSSRFGAFNHSHADQNSVVYVSQGWPLLINAGYYPYYNSPHHKTVGRSTRYKNALTFDGGIGQSEDLSAATLPSAPVHSMDASGTLLRTETRGGLSAVTGDATAAYRAFNAQSNKWTPLLSNALRSVVTDRASGITLIYDWATSTTPRRWELNYHSPNPFNVDAATVKASNGAASVCLDRYGPASSFAQTTAWDVAPEVSRPAQAHGRFTVLAPSTELAHLTVLRDGCRIQPVQVQQSGTRIQVTLGAQVIGFDKRQVQLSP